MFRPQTSQQHLSGFSDVGYQGNFLFFSWGATSPDCGTRSCKAFKTCCHFHSHRHVSSGAPAGKNSLWQAAAGSDQPPVILFLHMASSVKHSLHIPARAPRGTCDWLACCRHSCQGSPSVLINAIDLPKSCLPRQLGALLAQPTAN